MSEPKWYEPLSDEVDASIREFNAAEAVESSDSPMADNVLLAAVGEGVTLTPVGEMSLRFIGSRLAWLRMELAKVRMELEKRR